ncbi:hypothetical protein ACH4E8_34315 [Streptomyces sp. NPDC017979]|uniref:hypothetical protein n=1 Tax=Streptomyces sp. NPDC017979 TaxID=3365024 RepID=UPI0037AA72DF
MKPRLPVRLIRTSTLGTLKVGAELASALRTDLAAAVAAIESYRVDLAGQDEVREHLAETIAELRTERVAAEIRTADLDRLTTLLLGALAYTGKAAEAPVSVLVNDGVVHSVYRDPKSAMVASGLPWDDWVEVGEGSDGPAEGWKIRTKSLPRLPAPDFAGEIQELMERLERPAADQLAEAGRLQQTERERDTAVQNAETAAVGLVAESVAAALYRAHVAEIASELALALSASDPAGAVREVSRLLLQHAETLGIDPHGPGPAGAVSSTAATEGEAR